MATDEGVACATRPRGARPQGDGPWGHAPAGTSRALVARAGIPRPSGLSMRNCGRLLVPCHRRHTVSTAGGRLMLRTRPNSFMRPATLWLDSITRVMLSWCLGAICRRDGSDQPHVDPEQRSHPARVCFEDAGAAPAPSPGAAPGLRPVAMRAEQKQQLRAGLGG